MGGKTTSTTATKLDGISVQSSSLGKPLSLGWGRGRLSCNLIWYGAFTAIPHTTSTKAGKGLGGGSKNTTYTYTASIMLGICEGPVTGIGTVYRDKSVFTDGTTTALAQADLSLATGALDQAAWGYLVSQFPDQALAYSGIAYTYAQDYDLSDSATLPNHSFEVDFPVQVTGLADANPADIATDFLTNVSHGLPGWGFGLLGDLSDWSTYCLATGLLLSPVVEEQRQASDFLTEITDATNTSIFWSEGLLKARAMGDATTIGNGVTWTPNLAPLYDLTEDDFSPADGDPPVVLEIVDQSDAYNIVQVEFLDRANQYNTSIASAQDLANVVQFGRRKQDPTSWHSLCDAAVAQQAATLLLQRTLYIREKYHFRLPWDFALLEQTDLVTLSTSTDGLLLDRVLVRILEIDEDEDGLLSMIAEPVPVGAASAALYAEHSGSGFSPNHDVAPGSVNTPILFNAPSALTQADPEVWCAAASLSPTWGGCQVWISADGDSYTMVGSIYGPARYGSLTAALPAHADPDNDDVLHVSLAASKGSLLGGTAAEMNTFATLCLVGSELLSYQNATLVGSNAYNLSPLRRGLYGSTPTAHGSGSSFVRLDESIFKFSYSDLNVGTTVYVKLPSFNVYGRAIEDLADVPGYAVTLALGDVPAPITGSWAITATSISANGVIVPTLVIEGAVGNPNADLVVFEVRPYIAGSTPDERWETAGTEVSTATKHLIGTVTPGTAYDVAVRYRVRGVIGERLILSTATTSPVQHGAYKLISQSVAYPITSDATTISIEAFSGVIEDGREMDFPAHTVTGKSSSTSYEVFWQIYDSSYHVLLSPAATLFADPNLIWLGSQYTSSTGGTYPDPPAPPPGYRPGTGRGAIP